MMDLFKPFALYAGASICLGSLFFAGFRIVSSRLHKEGN